EADRVRNEWLRAVDELSQQARGWAEQQGWPVTQTESEVEEDELGTYTAPVLEIDAPEGQLVLRPIARDGLRAAGRVDLTVWPSLYRVMLLRVRRPDPGERDESHTSLRTPFDALEAESWDWVVRTESGIDWPHPWGQDTFVDLGKRLLRVA